jgi:hypothetical protein
MNPRSRDRWIDGAMDMEDERNGDTTRGQHGWTNEVDYHMIGGRIRVHATAQAHRVSEISRDLSNI